MEVSSAIFDRRERSRSSSGLESENERGEVSAAAVGPAKRDSMLRRLLAVGDAASVLIVLVVTLLIPGERATMSRDLGWSLVAIPVFVAVFKLYGLYDRDVKRISHSTVDDLPWLFHATIAGSLLVWLYSKVSPMNQLDLMQVVVFGLLVLGFVCATRATLRHVVAQRMGAEPALLVGSGKMAAVLVNKLRAHPEYRLNIVGSLVSSPAIASARAVAGPGTRAGVTVLGTLGELERIAIQHGIGRIVVSPRGISDRELAELLRRCRLLSLKVSILPALSETLGAGVVVDEVEGVTVLGVNPPWIPRSSRAFKRALDVTIALAMLVALSPLLLIVAILIKFDSRGPVFFRQERVGKNGRTFKLFKFRTMVLDAERLRAELLEHSSDANWLLLDHDPRITRIGRRLRRLSLDELPQLWNVLRGEMSIVGPRPLIVDEDQRVEGWARGRLNLTPGITGYWQVLGRTRIPFDEMVKLDYLYVTNWSLWEDVRLILRTLPIVLSGRGAN